MKRFFLGTVGLLAFAFIGLMVAAPVITCGRGSTTNAMRNACIINLRQIETAKEQWAKEMQRPDGESTSSAQVAQYIKGGKLPRCPKGGAYEIGPVGKAPECSISGHRLQ